jgi:hypothetical protein
MPSYIYRFCNSLKFGVVLELLTDAQPIGNKKTS